MKLLKSFSIALLLFQTFVSDAQVGIGTTTPNASAALDISSTSQGFLPPRMTHVQKLAITSPVAGLTIWCNNCGTSGELQVYNGSTWTNLIGGSPSPASPTLAATTTATAITANSATSGGNITNDGNGSITARGVCWNTSPSPTISLSTKTTNGTGAGSFSSNISSLNPGTTYYVRAYATNSIGTSYGSEMSFTTTTTWPSVAPTTAVSSITATSAVSGGNVTSDGGTTVTARGICWSTSTGPTIALSTKTANGTGPGSFSSNLTSLSPGTTYYVRAYATNSGGTTYGDEVTFTTLFALPTITSTTSISSITSVSAISGGNITSDGGTTTTRGVCWSTSPNPTISLSTKTTDGTGTGVFSSNITGLTVSTIYYVRAYATNSVGTVYGNEVSFTATFAIGESYQGGKIAYIFQSGDPGYIAGQIHGIIAAAADQYTSSGTGWGYQGSTVSGADGTALGTGYQNTLDIIANCPTCNSSYAAYYCNNLVLNGYSDWYLPSTGELMKLALNKTAIGGFSDAVYWSSTEKNSIEAFAYNFSTNALTYGAKSNIYDFFRVRAIRSF